MLIYRLRDIIIALVGITLLSPLFIIMIIALYITQGKVFFVQYRPGLNEEMFPMLKFRTLEDRPSGPLNEKDQQDRMTPLGKYLRKYSLDELPQLVNVLRGEMSIIGPRPFLADYLPLYTQEERKRHNILPGITGWAQINGRNKISYKQRFAYDLWYVKNRTFMLDIKIILMTFSCVLFPKDVFADEKSTSHQFDGTN